MVSVTWLIVAGVTVPLSPTQNFQVPVADLPLSPVEVGAAGGARVGRIAAPEVVLANDRVLLSVLPIASALVGAPVANVIG